ncbi:MAG TPA: FKBP-type peptidyl-prolyl cis-trans isomerase [Solirubrobacterales bacterium]|nr:FKBP-type peptidyl-prolyl cis-trans isomerase [Solirubrobacterales bacterium]
MLRGLLLTILLCAGLAIAGCGGGDDSTSTGGGETTSASAPAESTETKPTVEVPSGPPPKKLESEDLVEGEGAEARAGDEVSVQYVGVNYKSGKEFDSSWSRNEPFTFPLGAGEVIAGWDQGVEGMKVGGRRELTIPPELGYGPGGYPPAIPPNETLVFVVDLVAVK